MDHRAISGIREWFDCRAWFRVDSRSRDLRSACLLQVLIICPPGPSRTLVSFVSHLPTLCLQGVSVSAAADVVCQPS